MLSWEEARAKVLRGIEPLAPGRTPIENAVGLALGETLIAPLPMPPFDNSAMDGFAVRAADIETVSKDHPVRLEVIAERPAGTATPIRVEPGQAVRIMTGAPVPDGADTVVMVEATNYWNPETHRARPATDDDAHQVEIRQAPVPGANVRKTGESVKAGATFLEAGTRIGGSELGLSLSVGVTEVSAHPLPRVAVLSTGDELVPPGSPLAPGQIPDSNRPALLAILGQYGFPTLDLGLAADDPTILESRIRKGADEADFLITSGGVSVGDADLTREVLARVGNVESYRVAVKPGKPQLFGHVGSTPVFGLPGNPVSSLVVFDVFVLPALLKMAGRRTLFQPLFNATLATTVSRKSGRVEFMRVRVEPEDGVWVARSTGPQGSGVLSSMTNANAYAILPTHADRLDAGASVTCMFRGMD
jgi:molybdopterin molybdotransferase